MTYNSEQNSRKEWIAIYFRLPSGEQFGTQGEREMARNFAKSLDHVIQERHVGVYDGDEYGNGEGGLFIYGPNADILYDVVYPLLANWPALKGGYVIKRYGVPERSERIEFP